MRLNETIGELTDSWDQYGEWLYWLSIFGTPSRDEPWGWQLDGHHLNLNCLVARRPDGHDPAVHGLGADLRADRQVRRARACSTPRSRRARASCAACREASAPGGRTLDRGRAPTRAATDDRIQAAPCATTAPGIRRAARRRAHADAARPAAGADRGVRRPHAAGPRPVGWTRSSAHLDQTHVLLVRAARRRQHVLLPHPQPGPADRVRSPARHRASTTTSRRARISIRSCARRTATTTARTCCASTTRASTLTAAPRRPALALEAVIGPSRPQRGSPRRRNSTVARASMARRAGVAVTLPVARHTGASRRHWTVTPPRGPSRAQWTATRA